MLKYRSTFRPLSNRRTGTAATCCASATMSLASLPFPPRISSGPPSNGKRIAPPTLSFSHPRRPRPRPHPETYPRKEILMSTATLPAAPHRTIRAPRGPERTCKGWIQEAALRMLMNNLDPEVAEDPDRLVVYGGSGKAARTWQDFDRIAA